MGEREAGRRLDVLLAEILGVPRRVAARLAARVRVNSRPGRKGLRVLAGEEIEIPETPAPRPAPDVAIVRETPHLLVVAKPPGVASVSVAGSDAPTVAAWLAERFPECASVGAPGESGLVHRLDRDTSGLLLAARRADAYEALRRQFRRHEVLKTYLAVVSGRLERAQAIDLPLGRLGPSRMQVVRPGGAAVTARTEVAPLRVLAHATVVRARTRTGVRHQVRVHLAAIGHPLIGDARYGGPPIEGGHRLHACALCWRGPAGEFERACLPPPAEWERWLR